MPSLPWRSPIQSWLGGLVLDRRFWTSFQPSATSGNERLVRLSSSVVEQAHRARLLTVKLRPWPSSSNDDHAYILDCIARRNPEEARTALEAHRRRGIATLCLSSKRQIPTRTSDSSRLGDNITTRCDHFRVETHTLRSP